MVYITVLINIQLKSAFIMLMQLNVIHPLSAKTVEKIFSHYPRNQVADLKRIKLSEKKLEPQVFILPLGKYLSYGSVCKWKYFASASVMDFIFHFSSATITV